MLITIVFDLKSNSRRGLRETIIMDSVHCVLILERLRTTKIRKISTVQVRVTKVATKIRSNATETEQIYENIFRNVEY